MTRVAALAMPSVGSAFERTTIERRSLRSMDVQIEIRYAGICHTDFHQAMEGKGRNLFPMVPGHEIAGVVTAVGAGVTAFTVGDHVGVGCFVDSCGQCAACRDGDEQFCAAGPVSTYNGVGYDGHRTYGGYSESIVVSERFVVRIPATLPLDRAAPLLCAGVTLFSPLCRAGIGPASTVGVVGFGGLGHIGVQLAHAMGAHVTVLSQTTSKFDDAHSLGADACFATAEPANFEQLADAFDLLVHTAPASLDVDRYLSLVRRRGTLVYVGAPTDPQTFRAYSLVARGRSITGSMIGGIAETQAMLDFCAAHGIAALTETIGADEVDEAYRRLAVGDVRYRFVIDIATVRANER